MITKEATREFWSPLTLSEPRPILIGTPSGAVGGVEVVATNTRGEVVVKANHYAGTGDAVYAELHRALVEKYAANVSRSYLKRNDWNRKLPTCTPVTGYDVRYVDADGNEVSPADGYERLAAGEPVRWVSPERADLDWSSLLGELQARVGA